MTPELTQQEIEQMPEYFVHDTICGEMEAINSIEDAKKFVKDAYTEGDSMHPDFYSFDIYQKVGSVDLVEDELGNATGFEVKYASALTSERLKHKAEIQALEKEVKDLRFENGVLKKIADLYHNQTNP